jgi:ankyrin repeat protein
MNLITSHIHHVQFTNNSHIVSQNKTNILRKLKDTFYEQANQKLIDRNIIEYETNIQDWENNLLSSINKSNCADLIDCLNAGEYFKTTKKLFETTKIAIITSARLKNKDITKILLNYFQDNFPTEKLFGFNNPLYHAVCAKDINMMEFLVNEGFYSDVTLENGTIYSDRTTIMNKAVASGHVSIVSWLLRQENNIDELMRRYQNPLFIAATNGRIQIMEMLLNKGVGANRFIGEKSPLYQASWRGYLQAVKLLLDFSADVNCRFYGKETAVYVAAKCGYTNIVKVLLTKHSTIGIADPNSVSSGKDTPLYAAVSNGHIDTARALLDAGADPDALASGDDTPLSIAKKNGDESMIILLLIHNATVSVSR